VTRRDDFVMVCKSPRGAVEEMNEVRCAIISRAKLELIRRKSRRREERERTKEKKVSISSAAICEAG